MKRIVKRLRGAFVVVASSLLFAGAASGQAISEAYCKQIEESVVKPLHPRKIYRAETFSNECVFEFTVGEDNDMSLTIQTFKTEKASRDSLDGFLELIALGNGLERKDLRFERLDTNNSWDEVFFLPATTMNSAVLALRKQKSAIRILSRKDSGVVQIEKLLRGQILAPDDKK